MIINALRHDNGTRVAADSIRTIKEMSLVRRWAAFRGESCLATIHGWPIPYEPGQELVVGNRAYVVTRILRAAGISRVTSSWEVWGRRIVTKRKASVP